MQLDRYKFVVELSPVPMLLSSSSGKILLTNNLLNRLFEYKSTEITGQNVDILVPQSSRQHHPDLRSNYFEFPSKRKMGQGRELSGITKTGRIIPLELGLDPVSVEGDVCALVVAIDIRQRKLHDELMKLAMDAAASAMIMVDKNGNVVFINKAAISLFGYQEAEILNRPVEQLVPQEVQQVHPGYRRSFMNSSQARAMAKEKNLYALHRKGHKIPVEIALTPVETPDGKMVVSTIIDLTDRIAARRETAKKSEELARVNHELTQFAYSASHDLKAPLSSIAGLLKFCLEDLEEGNIDEVRENLGRCLQISARSAEKIEGVLQIARVGREDKDYKPANLEKIIRDAWMDLTGTNENGIQLLLDLRHKEPAYVESVTFRTILENLLSNAVRYGDHNKPEHFVEIVTYCDQEYLYIAVSDNGIGIPMDRQHVVFDMFSRIDERSGDGLGMALVKKHIDHLGGSISFTSNEKDGTTFNVSLPLRRSKALL